MIKAAPALFLTGLSWYLDQTLIALIFLFCASATSSLTFRKTKWRMGFRLARYRLRWRWFGLVASRQRAVAGYPLLPLALTNIVIAVFVLRWVFPMLKGAQRVLEVSYFGMLIVSNIFACHVHCSDLSWAVHCGSCPISRSASGARSPATPRTAWTRSGFTIWDCFFWRSGF